MAKKTKRTATSQSSNADAKKGSGKDSPLEEKGSGQNTRETVESIVVAFILAFLFRAFVAEAFVIPTGSMAPTLMGAHKDLFCEHCGQQYQASASIEYDSSSGALMQHPNGNFPKTIASLCANCRGINAYDFGNNADHESFSGDRILVSKFDYVLSSPERWDVFVFKYPKEARMNYIKRLVGLPGETLLIRHGDVFIEGQSDSGEWNIARKPAHKVQAMKRLVHNTSNQPSELVKQGWPSSWQPVEQQANASAWNVDHTPESWSATLASTSEPQWLRYYHKVADVETWRNIETGQAIKPADPYESQLITDFLAYNSPYVMEDARQLFDLKQNTLDRFLPGPFRRGPYFTPDPERTGGEKAFNVTMDNATIGYLSGYKSEGDLNWVGDLSGDFKVEIESDAGTLLLDLVEYGIHFQCAIDVATGQATVRALDGQSPVNVFVSGPELSGNTGIRGAGSYRLEFANFDDQLYLWVDGSAVEFEGGAAYDLATVRTDSEMRPHWTESDPLDAAPIGIGGQGIALNVESARVYRDIYYIADAPGARSSDFSSARITTSPSTIPDRAAAAVINREEQVIASVFANPSWWSETDLFEKRGSAIYELQDKQYFPMGDNSAASSDARAWYGHNYVDEQYLLGKALLVFFPHTWNSPVPFTPNIQRMGLIR